LSIRDKQALQARFTSGFLAPFGLCVDSHVDIFITALKTSLDVELVEELFRP